MDKYPYFTEKICINTTKPLIFVHFFILAQQTSLHNGEGEITPLQTMRGEWFIL